MRLLFVSGLLLSCLGVVAQPPICGPQSVPITVLGIPADQMAALTPGDFKLFLNGRPQRIDTVNFGVFPHATYILVDRSGSMRNSRYWHAAADLALLAAKYAKGGPVKIAAFDEKLSNFVEANTLQNLDAEKFVPLLQAQAQSRTALLDAVAHTLQQMPHMAPEDTIVVITDGGEDKSSVSRRDLEGKLSGRRTRLIAVLIPPEEQPGLPAELSGMQDFFEVVSKSGGAVLRVFLPSAPGVRLALSERERRDYQQRFLNSYVPLQSDYRLSVPAFPRGAKLKVELSPNIRGASLFYPPSLDSCGASGE